LSRASGATQETKPLPTTGLIFYYVAAFLVGYREETFRELMKRATDMILQPGAQQTLKPLIVVKSENVPVTSLSFGSVEAKKEATKKLSIYNTGNAPVDDLAVTVEHEGPSVFVLSDDKASHASPLSPGSVRNVDIVFAPQVTGNYMSNLAISGTGLPSRIVVRLDGSCT
jgi:hypothetical protein